MCIKALPRNKISSRKHNPSSQPKDALRGQCQEDRGLVPTKKAAAGFCDSKIEDIDLEKQLKIAGGMLDENDCMWLISECNFSSLPASDGSGDVWELNSLKKSPWDTLSESSPSNVARFSSVHDLTSDTNADLSEKECSRDNPPACWCESSGISCDRSLENLSTYWTSCYPMAALDDSARSIWESDKTGIWISSLDLNLQGYELLPPKEVGLSISYSYSSASNISRGTSRSEFLPYSSSSATSFGLTEASWSSLEYDEPLFWPYHQDLCKLPELDNSCLCVSPQRDGMTVSNKEMKELKSVDVQLCKTNSLPASRKRMQQR